MNRTRTSPARLSGLLLTTLHTAVLLAASSLAAASERLYAVELIVFSREAASFEEVWPDDVALHYPPHARPLAPEGFDQMLAESAEAGVESETPAAELNESAAEPAAAATPPLLQSLGRDTYALSGVANALARRSEYRMLLHERWVQPAQVDGRAVPIAVRGGERYGEHHELEGFVRLQVGRLLHFQANLWLSDFTGTAAVSTPDEEEEFAVSRRPQPAGIFLPTPPELPEPPSAISMQSLLFEEAPESELETWTPAPAEPLLPRQVIVLEQRRRVKFGELHYLDHPQFGAIVQVTAIDPEVPAEES